MIRLALWGAWLLGVAIFVTLVVAGPIAWDHGRSRRHGELSWWDRWQRWRWRREMARRFDEQLRRTR